MSDDKSGPVRSGKGGGPKGPSAFRDELHAAMVASGASIAPALLDVCAIHYDLLVRWNKTHNLTRVTDAPDAARRHYLDCLLPLQLVERPRSLADVGSGAGFPGLLAAATWPDIETTLVEPAQKRASFLRVAAAAMGLRVRVVDPGTGSAALVTSRATFSTGVLETVREYVLPGGAVALWASEKLDRSTWNITVDQWGWSGARRLPYHVEGIRDRALVLASRPPLASD